MRKRDLAVLLVAAILSAAACESFDTPLTRFQPPPVAPAGTLRIMGVTIPQVIREEAPLDVTVRFMTEGAPPVEQVCVRWVRDRAPGTSVPDFYAETLEVEGHPELARSAARHSQAVGYSERVSNLSCMKPLSLFYGPDARMTLRVQAGNIKGYNRMECHVTYLREGELIDSNVASIPIEVL